MAATLGAGVVEPGVVCDVMGTAEPVCAVVAEPAHDPTGLVELHPHADPDTWLLENPGWLSGGAYRWFRDELGGEEAARAKASGADVYELLNGLAQCAPPGAGGVTWLPALAGAMAPEWNANARAAWFGMTAAHGRAHLARALLEGNALALRDVIEAIAGAGHAPSDLVCVGGGAKGRLLLELRAHITGLPVCRPEDVETTARGAAMLAAAGAGLHSTVAEAARAMAGDAARARAAGRGAARGLRRTPPPAPGVVRGAATAVRGIGWRRFPCEFASRASRGRRAMSALDAASRRRALDAATSGDLDVLVVGGGITGAGAALDAATRGLRVALVEARDLAAGTSSASSKLIHGGLRYLEMGDLGLVREALRERELLLTRLAPHLVAPVPFLWPLRGRGWERAYLGAGLVLYDTIGGARSVPRHRHLSRRGALAVAPGAAAGRAGRRRPVPRRRRGRRAHGRLRRPHRGRPRCAHRDARAGHRLPAPGRGRGARRGDRRAAAAAGAARRRRRRRVDRPPPRAGRRHVVAPHRAVEGHPHLRRPRPAADGHRRARPHREERALRDPVAGRLADRRHRHAVAARSGHARRDRRRRRLPAGQDERAAVGAAHARRRPRRDRRPAAAGRRRGAQRHDAHQPQARGRDARARADDDRRRQVHDLPRDGRRPDRRRGAGNPLRDPRRPAARRGSRGRSSPR